MRPNSIGILVALVTLPLSTASAEPTLEWVAQYHGASQFSSDMVADLISDAVGNTYMTGQTQLPTGRQVATTVKFSLEGERLWAVDYTGPTVGGPEDGARIAFDPNGNVVVAGHLGVEGPNFPGPDIFVAKYSPDGVRLWAASHGHDSNGRDWDTVTDLIVDGAGNIYLTGSADNGSASGDDVQTISFDANGNLRWARLYDGPGHWHDRGAVVEVDAQGFVYVAGHISMNTGFNTDYVTLKYDADGNLIWAKTYGAAALRQDQARALDVDDAGNVYVTGWYEPTANNRNVSTLKYGPDGTQMWAKQYATTGQDEVGAIRVTRDGNIVIAATSGIGSSFDGVLALKYRPDGTTVWSRVVPDLEVASMGRRVLAEDDRGDLYLLNFEVVAGDYQYHPIQFDGATGEVLWETSHGTGTHLEEYPVAISVNAQRSIFVAGVSYRGAVVSDWDYTLTHWSQQDPASVDGGSPASFAVQAYPNPARTRVALSFPLQDDSFVKVQLIDAQGRIARTLLEEERSAGPQSLEAALEGVPAGVYWARVTHAQESQAVRLTVVR